MSTGLTQNIPGVKIRLRSQYIRDMLISLVHPHALHVRMYVTRVAIASTVCSVNSKRPLRAAQVIGSYHLKRTVPIDSLNAAYV